MNGGGWLVALICPLGWRARHENKISSVFATFLRLGTLFCLCRAEMGRFAVDLLRVRA